MTVVQKYKSEIYVSGKDWHAGICFYSLVYLELEIFKDNSCKLTRKIYLDKSGGGFNHEESFSWQGDLKEMVGTKYVLLKPDKEGLQELKIWFEKVPKNSEWIYFDILRPDNSGDFKYSQELILKLTN
jgi:hypothetical protein